MTTEDIRKVRRLVGWWALVTVAVTVAVGVDCLLREPVPGQTTPKIERLLQRHEPEEGTR